MCEIAASMSYLYAHFISNRVVLSIHAINNERCNIVKMIAQNISNLN